MPEHGPTRTLAEFVSELSFDKIPQPVRERVKDIVLDAVASALAGNDASETVQVVALAESLGSSRESSVIGGGHLSSAGATLVNSYLITAVTVCDIHRPTSCHVTPEVVGPALVIAESLGSTGRDFIVAIASGLEITTRVGLGLGPVAFRAHGWHAPGVTGPFGGAAAVGKLLGLDAIKQQNAFGIAASQAAGTYAQLGTPTIKFQQSRGALGGLVSAKLAEQGFGAAEEPLTNPDGGLFNAYSDGGSTDEMLAGLGKDWELTRISLRAWPVAVHLQPVVTGLMKLIEANDLRPDGITEVHVGISDTAYRMHGTRPWEDRFLARLSAPYVTGVVIHDRRCWLEQFTHERVKDSSLDKFVRERVKVVPDTNLADGTSTIEITTTSGAKLREHTTVAKGEPENPMSHGEIVDKFRAASAGRLSPVASQQVIDLITQLESVQSMRAVIDNLRASEDSAARSVPELVEG
ncbi:MAG: MmgE/PrpD family protein [Candidatus Dormibacteria bacterium]